MGKQRSSVLLPGKGMENKTLEELWRNLKVNEKKYLLAMTSFNNNIDAIRWLREHKMIPPKSKSNKVKEMAWVYSRRVANPSFKQFEYLRPDLHHDDVIALHKKDYEILMWVKATEGVLNDPVSQKNDVSTLRKFGGKVPAPEGPIGDEDIDWSSIGDMPSPIANGRPTEPIEESV